MNQRTITWLALLAGWITIHTIASTQAPRTSGLYQIDSGTYTQVGGIWGSLTGRLPNVEQGFVALATDPQNGRVAMTILAQDQQTIFLLLTNGMISGSTIRFQQQTAHPYSNVSALGTVDYAVTNIGGTLRIDGAIRFPPICCDIPNYFSHSNVFASAVPVLAIRASEVELCWNCESNRSYQVQYRTDLTTNGWTNLGPPVLTANSTACIFDKVLPGQPQKFYRIVTVPRTLQLDETGAGTTVELAIGQLLEIVLVENPSTGYLWKQVAGDSSVLRPVGEPEFVPPPPAAIGAPGKRIFRFEAVTPSQTLLRLENRQWWQPDQPPAKTFEVTVGVRPLVPSAPGNHATP
jgi:predicted secreted protein